MSIITLHLLIYAINRMFKHEEIQYLEVDELTNDIIKFIHSLINGLIMCSKCINSLNIKINISYIHGLMVDLHNILHV